MESVEILVVPNGSGRSDASACSLNICTAVAMAFQGLEDRLALAICEYMALRLLAAGKLRFAPRVAEAIMPIEVFFGKPQFFP